MEANVHAGLGAYMLGMAYLLTCRAIVSEQRNPVFAELSYTH